MSHPATTTRPGAGRHLVTRLAPSSGWTVAAVAVASVVAMPIFAVVASLATPRLHVWGHLLRTQMGELVANTVLLLVGVGAGVLVLGTFLAWLVVTYQFPGRAVFEWALMLPLAMPAYVIGFVFLGLFDFAGPAQTALRNLFGPGVRLPNLSSGWGVILMMTLVFYPYVYTLARMAFLEQAPGPLESARSLGYSRFQAFLRVTLPMARPSLVAGVSLALMEALADFGTVATFGYRTLTEAIYRVWYGMFDRIAATQLAVVLLGFAFMVLLFERASRGRARFTQGRGRGRPLTPTALTGFRAWAASGSCVTVLLLAFGLPVAQLAIWAFNTLTRQGLPLGFGSQLENSLWLAAVSAATACVLAVVLAYALRLHPTPGVTLSTRFAAMGYALPGAVIAVGVLLPMAWLDHFLANVFQATFRLNPGLVFTGSAAGLVFAYLVRFLAVSFQTVDASLTKIPKNLDEAARSLGVGAGGTLRQVHLPLIHRGLLAALALVFVDVMKEMPATLLLRPFGLNTLAVGVWQFTAESLWEEAAVPALAIVVAGLVPVALAMRWISPDGPVAFSPRSQPEPDRAPSHEALESNAPRTRSGPRLTGKRQSDSQMGVHTPNEGGPR